MKIIFHPLFLYKIDETPAGEKDRLSPMVNALQQRYPSSFVKPSPATHEDLRRAHSESHIESIKFGKKGRISDLYNYAILAAGGAIRCIDEVMEGEPSFGLIRPPGHHASENSCWGFCYFNNIAIALLYLRSKFKKRNAILLDFDLHTGDGNINILREYRTKNNSGYEIFNPDARNELEYLEKVEQILSTTKKVDIVSVSAGFDQGIEDWGNLLSPSAYTNIGIMLKDFAEDHCKGRRFALLEGGYNPEAMAKNSVAFLEGFF